MSQHDFEILKTDANTGVSFRSEVNAALQALASRSSGATEPAVKCAYQCWADTASGFMKQRNAANTAWLTLYSLASTQFATISGAETLTNKTLTNPILNSPALSSPIFATTITTGTSAAGHVAAVGEDPLNVPSHAQLGSAAYADIEALQLAGYPVTVTTSTSTIANNVVNLIVNYAGTCTLTLPSAAGYPGQTITIKTITANAVVSASSNVVTLTSATAGTAILAATAGKYAKLVSDGTNWTIMEGN